MRCNGSLARECNIIGMDRYRVKPVISEEMMAALTIADERSVRAGLLGAKPEGLFKVPE